MKPNLENWIATLFNVRRWLRHREVEAFCYGKWWMGHAYFNFETGRQVVILFPFNFLWRWWHWLEHWWLKNVCCGRSWIDEYTEGQNTILKERVKRLTEEKRVLQHRNESLSGWINTLRVWTSNKKQD